MPDIIEKTLYVLGAGASRHAGTPLLRDFLTNARLLMQSVSSLKHKAAFESTFDWIDSMRASAYYVEIDLDNIEHIFSLAEMMRQMNLEGGSDLSSNLKLIIAETLDHCTLKQADSRLVPSDAYGIFTQHLYNMNKKRRRLSSDREKPFEHDSIITFNYDVMLDFALFHKPLSVDYCLDDKPKTNSYKLLKLHGSTNWGFCKKCYDNEPDTKNEIQPAIPTPTIDKGTLRESKGLPIPFKMATGLLAQQPCKYCKEHSLEPYLIPPTWSKAIERSPLIDIWRAAIEEIKSAYQIVVIGYSLPSTDTFFQYLLALGLAENPALNRIIIIDKDDSDDFKNRYRNVLSRSLADRKRVKFYTEDIDGDFLQFIQNSSARDMLGTV